MRVHLESLKTLVKLDPDVLVEISEKEFEFEILFRLVKF